MTQPRTQAEWIGLLSKRIEQSGLPVQRFAREVLRREPRTVFRWLAGRSPIPNRVRLFLEHPEPAPWP